MKIFRKMKVVVSVLMIVLALAALAPAAQAAQVSQKREAAAWSEAALFESGRIALDASPDQVNVAADTEEALPKAKKRKSRSATAASIDLDESIAPLVGKQVFFFIRINETTVQKFPAVIVDNYRGRLRSVDGLPNPHVESANPGSIIVKIDVTGPDGHFYALAFADSGRSSGSWDTKQPGDLFF